MFCSNCGSKLSEGARFCSICGVKLPEMPGQEVRTFGDFDFEEPKRVEEPAPEAAKVIDEIPEVPKRESLSFDWSNVTDEPRKREIPDIKSPWAATGGVDEKELYAEMTPSTDKSRTMNFIDVLKAEKEEKERKAADQAIEYTQVLELDADLTAFDEMPKLHYAPLYEDVDAPVRTPFDDIETTPEPALKEEPRFEKPEPVFREEPRFERPEPAVKPEPEVTASRETIAMFEDYVKSFEAEAGITREEPKFEDTLKEVSRFELPDFLKKAAGFVTEEVPEPEQPAPASEFDNVEIKETAAPEPVVEAAAPEPEVDLSAYVTEEETAAPEPEVDLSAYEIRMDDDPGFEEPAFEEPKYDDGGFDVEEPSDMEDMYLTMDFDSAEFGRTRIEPEEEEEEEFEGIDEAALFAEMQEPAPKKTGMTIAAPADRESEIEALKSRLAELMGNEDPAPAPIAEGAVTLEELNRAEFTFEPVINPEVDELFDGPIQGLQETVEEEIPEIPVIRLETEAPAHAAPEPVYTAPAYTAPEPVYTAPAVEPAPVYEPTPVVPAAPAAEPAPAPQPVYTAPVVEPAPVMPAVPVEPEPVPQPVYTAPAVEPAPVYEPTPVVPAAPVEPEPVPQPVYTAPAVEPAPVYEPTPVVPAAPVAETPVPEPVYTAPAVEEIYTEPAPVVVEEPVVIETVEAAEPVAPAAVDAPVVEVAEEAAAVEEEKSSDALSLEDIERDLFGDVPAADVEAEETKKIDKFYTLYRKNEEFQRLLDEEYDKLKGEEKTAAAAEVIKDEPAVPAEIKLEASPAPVVEAQPVEDSKAYRQIEDETIYQAFEIPKELLANADGGAAASGPVEVMAADKPLVEVESSGSSNKKEDKKAAKAAAKAEKARKKEEKKLAKSGRSEAAASEVEYEDVDSGSGFLTVLAVIIAIILVILLAVILILQVAPDSGIAIAIDSLIENITGGFSLFDPGNGQFLL